MPLHSALNFANMISGYCRVHDNNDMMLTLPIPESMAGLFVIASLRFNTRKLWRHKANLHQL